MAYTSAALNLTTMAPLAAAGQVWHHAAANTGAEVQADGYITDAKDKGMRVGDTVLHRNTATNIVSAHVVVAINANGSADLSDSTTHASGTDSD